MTEKKSTESIWMGTFGSTLPAGWLTGAIAHRWVVCELAEPIAMLRDLRRHGSDAAVLWLSQPHLSAACELLAKLNQTGVSRLRVVLSQQLDHAAEQRLRSLGVDCLMPADAANPQHLMSWFSQARRSAEGDPTSPSAAVSRVTPFSGVG